MSDEELERTAARQLALEIARCPIIEAVQRGDPSPCREIVTVQKRPANLRWVAEPWSGHLERAPILFLSSNPSAGDPEAAPIAGDLTVSSDDEALLHSFTDAFDPGRWIGIHEGTHLRSADGTPGAYVAYWGSCLARASEVLGRGAAPGLDYALTEVVHCGSQHEYGVKAAAQVCISLYMDRVLSLSPAAVVIVVGSVARDIVRTTIPALAGPQLHVGPITWAGRSRHVLFLPHPNARRVPKGVASYLGSSGEDVVRVLRGAVEATRFPISTT